jgi:hypothetical protein
MFKFWLGGVSAELLCINVPRSQSGGNNFFLLDLELSIKVYYAAEETSPQ